MGDGVGAVNRLYRSATVHGVAGKARSRAIFPAGDSLELA